MRGGASDRNRTNATRIFSPLLYQLSYRGKFAAPIGTYIQNAPFDAIESSGDPERARTVDLQRDRLAF